MSEIRGIGFGQRIQLDWLEYAASLAQSGASRSEMTAALDELLQDRLSVGNQARWNNREKAILILTRVWGPVDDVLAPVRRDGLALLSRLPADEHVAIHWCMTMAVYPFFGAVADTTGRLLRLQGSCAAGQVQQRLREQFGERETVSRAAQRIIRCFYDWGILVETGEIGVYALPETRPITDPVLGAFMAECVIRARGVTMMALADVVQSPMLFPFDLRQINRNALHEQKRLELLRLGSEQDMVAMKGG